MNIKEINTVYFLGVGGIGMSALARYFLTQGCQVYGYDKTKTALTIQLEKEGIQIHYQEDVAFIKELFPSEEGLGVGQNLICYTPAIPNNNKELSYFRDNNFEILKRSQVLGLISQNYFTIAIAGTHGKTTTSSMVAHVLNTCGVDCIAFLGGISLNFNSNLLLNNNAKVLVVEADEFDRSFLTLSPDIALITSLDADHLDVYEAKNEMIKSYQDFVNRIKKGGVLITKPGYIKTLKVNEGIHYKTYGLQKETDFTAKKIRVKGGSYFVDVAYEEKDITEIELGLPGIHNVENAVGAFAIANCLAVDGEKIKQALSSFQGVHRRFEYQLKTPSLIYIDDYAHHPTELEFCIKSVRELYPNKKITGIFQPHLYSRTRDFVEEFAANLSLLDELILLDIYPAREEPIKGITSAVIFDKVTSIEKIALQKDELLNYIANHDYEVLLTLGAGDIDVFVQPIKELLIKKLAKVDL
ncbi:MAG: UDP-N-acetylmuramate--L-alanine ligase [Vicingus serpentipes]|nr:UDP-N-acetylmuramate--L-alanine ligase [Vicingus serpentipes]